MKFKLVRDHVPDQLREKSQRYAYHVAAAPEFRGLLLAKLGRKTERFIKERSLATLVDLYEILDTVCREWKFRERDTASRWPRLREADPSEHPEPLLVRLYDHAQGLTVYPTPERVMQLRTILDELCGECGYQREYVQRHQAKTRLHSGGFHERLVLHLDE